VKQNNVAESQKCWYIEYELQIKNKIITGIMEWKNIETRGTDTWIIDMWKSKLNCLHLLTTDMNKSGILIWNLVSLLHSGNTNVTISHKRGYTFFHLTTHLNTVSSFRFTVIFFIQYGSWLTWWTGFTRTVNNTENADM
jgi:hypothetical protein